MTWHGAKGVVGARALRTGRTQTLGSLSLLVPSGILQSSFFRRVDTPNAVYVCL